MRNVRDLRAYLLCDGFHIVDEALAREGERIYEIICAEYCGEAQKESELSLLIGAKNIENRARDEALFAAFCKKHASALRKKIEGMEKGGADTEGEEALLSGVEDLIG
jgi:tRNA (adenine22-N1)-methyltransferase